MGNRGSTSTKSPPTIRTLAHEVGEAEDGERQVCTFVQKSLTRVDSKTRNLCLCDVYNRNDLT